jgi:C-terminal processing protease CtpA/Prc
MLRSCVQLSDCSDVVLDLRDNPGGMVGIGIDVASTFLPNGAPFATIVGRNGQENTVRVEATRRDGALHAGKHLVCILAEIKGRL